MIVSRRGINYLLKRALFVSTIIMLWKSLMLLTNCAQPILVDRSGNACLAFHNLGDLLLLTNYPTEPIRAGDLVVFRMEGRDIPIVHRAMRVHQSNDGHLKVLTKGDGNSLDDRGLYPVGQLWLDERAVIGKVKGYLPYLGIVIVLLSRLPPFNFLLWAVGSTWY